MYDFIMLLKRIWHCWIRSDYMKDEYKYKVNKHDFCKDCASNFNGTCIGDRY